MTDYKTLRNKALSGCTRLITAVDSNTGQEWYCPDGYFATTFNIYDGYKQKKDQRVVENKPKMEFILDKLTTTPVKAKAGATDENNIVQLNYGDTKTLVNNTYLELLNKLHDSPGLWIDVNDKFAPVQVIKNNELVALIMPLKQ